MTNAFDAYRGLQAKVDDFFQRVLRRYADQIRCQDGCDRCCQSDLSLLGLEISVLLDAMNDLPPVEQKGVLDRARKVVDQTATACPFLCRHRCLVYAHRPIICRSQGLPLLIERAEQSGELSVCELNFSDTEQVAGDCVLDLDQLNVTLATIDHIVCQERGRESKRIPVSQALMEAFRE